MKFKIDEKKLNHKKKNQDYENQQNVTMVLIPVKEDRNLYVFSLFKIVKRSKNIFFLLTPVL